MASKEEKAIKQWIKQNPLTAVLAAGIIGLIIGAFFRRKR